MRIKTYDDGHWRIKPDKDAMRQVLHVIDRLPDDQRLAGRIGLAEIAEDLLSYPQLYTEEENKKCQKR